LEEDSIRVDGIGNAIISDVIYHPPTSSHSNEQHTEALKQLGTKKKVLQDEQETLEKQAQMLRQYSDSISVKDTGTSSLQTFLEVYQKRKAAINLGLLEVGDKIQRVNNEITWENKRHNKDEESKIRATRITVVVTANVDGPAELSVIYRQYP
jgi:septal ring factor EnvC (AmiA/AmiB activator)